MSLKFPAPRKRPFRVLIVDDHPIVRQGLRAMIEAEPDLRVCGEAQTEREARSALRALEPDAAVVDLSLEEGDGINLVRDAHAHHPGVALLVLSMYDENIYAERMLKAGASGYIMKQAASDQLITALHTVLRGDTYLSAAMRTRLGDPSSGGDVTSRLSTRELQVVSMIGRGHSSREIADALSLSVKTIESHRQSIKQKLNLETNAQLVQYALKWYGAPLPTL